MFTIRDDFGELASRAQERAWDYMLKESQTFCLLREAMHLTPAIRRVPSTVYSIRSDPHIDEVGDRVIDQIERIETDTSRESTFAFCGRVNTHFCEGLSYGRLAAVIGRWSFPAVSAWYRTLLWGRIPNLHEMYITVFSGICRDTSRDFSLL